MSNPERACPHCGREVPKLAEAETEKAALRAAQEPFAFYHRERCRLHPKVAKTDSTIPVESYGEARIGDKHFRAADAALSAPAGKGWVSLREAAQKVWDTIPSDFDTPEAEAHSQALVDLGAALDALKAEVK